MPFETTEKRQAPFVSEAEDGETLESCSLQDNRVSTVILPSFSYATTKISVGTLCPRTTLHGGMKECIVRVHGPATRSFGSARFIRSRSRPVSFTGRRLDGVAGSRLILRYIILPESAVGLKMASREEIGMAKSVRPGQEV